MMNPNMLNFFRLMAGNNVFVNNAVNMIQTGDMTGVEQLARNLCISKGLDPDAEYNKIKERYGTR